ncbi:receptor-like protein kinase [Seminavis robusta]|uniref:Receptor-like protein kinase n=1 Tax=Seminavis robusta TaxID=568900 RepID=A0A9N8E4M4_9STRA|nr:receptor-like protein kinase [Seminavis robusta]|eukprot:Sro662_g183360.1 receptor-like protein kinase (842) ;mRNA; f:22681-25724
MSENDKNSSLPSKGLRQGTAPTAAAADARHGAIRVQDGVEVPSKAGLRNNDAVLSTASTGQVRHGAYSVSGEDLRTGTTSTSNATGSSSTSAGTGTGTGTGTKAGLRKGAAAVRSSQQQNPQESRVGQTKAGLRRGADAKMGIPFSAGSASTTSTSNAAEDTPVINGTGMELNRDLQEGEMQVSPAAQPDLDLVEEHQNHTERLAVANLVEDDDHDQELPEAVEWNESQQRAKRNMHQTRMALLAVWALVVIAGIAVAVVVFSSSKKEDTIVINPLTDSPTLSPSDAPTLAPTVFSRQVRLELLLPEETLDSIINQEQSPQALAHHWTLTDPSFDSYPDDRLLQRFILATWFYATNGPSWFNNTHWLSYTVHECHWFQNSITIQRVISYLPYDHPHPMTTPCRNMSNLETGWQYEHLALAQNGVSGFIPPELFLLTSLRRIGLLLNLKLTGNLVGEQISKLTSLEILEVSNTNFQGSIPTEIGILTNLVDLSLAVEQLTGVIPTEIGRLTNLKYISSHRTNLEGPLPSEIGLLSNMLAINLGSNRMTSTIPSEILSLKKLMVLFLYEAQMSGTIPTEIGLLTDMVHLYIGPNRFEGTLPSELGLLTKLEALTINNNNITSTMPTTLGQLSSLFGMQFLGTGLTGTIPSEIGLIPFVGSDRPYSLSWEYRMYWAGGTYFSLAENPFLTGPIPSEVANMRGLEWFQLVDNKFTGSILPALGQLDLKKLELYGNNMDQTIPTELGQATNMQEFLIGGNSFWGTLPSELGLWTRLSKFDVSNCSLTGVIPGQLGSLAVHNESVLEYFALSGNEFEGTVPSGLCQLNASLLFDCHSGLCGCNCACA